MKKINSSALMIALIVGIVLSGILVGTVLTLGQYSKSSGQAREGQAAYRAALSGVEDGLLRYKYALAVNKANELYGTATDLTILKNDSDSPDITYDLTFKMDSISVGTKLNQSNTGVNRWKNNASIALAEEAFPALSDEVIDIDLTYLANISENGLGSVEIFYSNPFVKQDGEYSQEPFQTMSPRPFAALAVKLVDLSNPGEGQIIFEKVNNNRATDNIQVEDISRCEGASSYGSGTKQCHLQIKPQIAFTANASDREAGRFSGEGMGTVSDKYVFLKIRAKDETGKLIEATADNPGTLTIESTGKTGEAVRTVQAKVDASSGRYIGLLDFGIYCGSSCNMPSVTGSD